MIYVTGDCHGDYKKFSTKKFPEQKEMNKNDYVIICGDFGIWSDSKSQRYWFNWLSKKPFTTLFIDGNHENYDLLNTYPVEEWNGGKVQKIRPDIIHLMRGQVFTIDGKKFFTFGGAESHDMSGGILDMNDPNFKKIKKQLDKEWISYRIDHVSWWKEEMPSETEYQEGIENLNRNNWDVDYIITHCCASSIQNIFGYGLFKPNKLTDYLEDIIIKTRFKTHYFGHYHDDRTIMENYEMLYDRIIQI